MSEDARQGLPQSAGNTLEKKREVTGIAGVFSVIGLAALLTGCAYSMNEFSVADRGAVAVDSVVPAASTALLEDQSAVAVPGTAVTTAAVTKAPGYPNLNAPKDDPATHLLTPEEKAAVIAELEELARRQARGMSTR